MDNSLYLLNKSTFFWLHLSLLLVGHHCRVTNNPVFAAENEERWGRTRAKKKKKTTAKRKQERVSGNGPGLKGFSGSPSRSSTAICNVKCIMHRPQSWHFSKLLSCLINTVGWPPAVRAEQCAVLRNWSSTRAQIHYGFIKSHTYSSDSSASANVFISIKTIHIVPSLLDYEYFNFFFTMSVWT